MRHGDPAPCRAHVGRAGSIFLGLHGGQRLLRVLQPQRQLIRVELFRAAAEPMALQCLDDGAQPGALADRRIALLCNTGNRLRAPRSLGQQQRAQSIWIGRDRVGVGNHAMILPVSP